MGVQEYTMGHDMKNNSFELILFRKWPYGMNVEGQADYQSVIVVAPDRSLQKNEALRDERFAFGSIASTQWHFILARWIAEEGFIRIIHNSAFYPSSGIVANWDVLSNLIERVSRCCLTSKP